MGKRLATAVTLMVATGLGTAAGATCKSIPGDVEWPTDQAWSALNQTIGGRLIATVPVASVCHVGGSFDGRLNSAACAQLKPLWNFPVAHFPYPGEVSFPWAQNQSCDPFTPPSQVCELGNYVSYSVNVTGAADVVAGINFAKKENVRLVIKNTGHDYLGKSTGKGGLALWTHNLKTTEVIENYTSPYHTGPAIKLGAGVLAVEAYLAAHARGYRVVGGTCATVGIAGGYAQGGGHSTLSSVYGLAADNVLEWEVVTADGRHLVASPTSNEDLYWALSGGGGATFGVVLSMTARLHRDGAISGARLLFDDAKVGNDVFWDAVGAFHAALPPLLEQGVSALYSINNSTFNMFSLTAPGKSALRVVELLHPALAELDRRGIPFVFLTRESPDFLTHFATDLGPLPYGFFSAGQITGSRLVPRSVVLDRDANSVLTRALRNITATNDFFVACQALDVRLNSDSSDSHVTRVADNAVLPAWRDAATHCIVVGQWDYGAADGDVAASRTRMEERQRRLTEEITPMLEAATPGSGTYLNEADFQQRNFQRELYGANYERLLQIKRKYDPDGVFYAPTAVGSETFDVDGDGRLCRKE